MGDGTPRRNLCFRDGFWNKSHALWQEVQKANWDDVILKQSFKDTVRKDVNSFFDSEDLYKKLAIPWKVRVINPPAFIHLHGFSQRGIIMYGPPGMYACQ